VVEMKKGFAIALVTLVMGNMAIFGSDKINDAIRLQDVDTLHAMATDQTGYENYYRIDAANALAKLAPKYKNDVAQIALSMVPKQGSGTHGYYYTTNIIKIAQLLDQLGRQYQQESARIHLLIAKDKNAQIFDRLQSTQALTYLGSEYNEELTQASISLLNDHKVWLFFIEDRVWDFYSFIFYTLFYYPSEPQEPGFPDL
jgi:hypothetical protein